MKLGGYHRLTRVVTITLAAGALASTVLAAPSLSQPGQDIREQEPKSAADVQNVTPDRPAGGQEVHFTVRAIDLEAPDLKVNRTALAKISQYVRKKRAPIVQNSRPGTFLMSTSGRFLNVLNTARPGTFWLLAPTLWYAIAFGV